MHRPEGDLYEILGVDEAFDPVFVAVRFHEGKLTDDQRYAWKALSDPYYAALYRKTRSTRALFDAGFFDDGLDHLVSNSKVADTTFFTTSVDKLRGKDLTGRPLVLLTTGGMAPIHNGHIAMMEEARRQAEAQGWNVIGGYFAPGHDSYVGQKYNGTAAIPAAHRCAMVELAVKDSDWLELDPWAARYLPCEVNFTDIIRRMETYLIDALQSLNIEVAYVCGSDNAGFKAVCPERVFVVERSAISSKLAREGNHDHLNPEVRDYLLSWQEPNTGTLPYLIRNEEDDAIHNWASFFGGPENMTKRRIQLQSAVRLGIAQLFKNQGHEHKVHLLPVSKQREAAAKIINGRETITLDPFFPSLYEISSTRYFPLCGDQFKPLYRGARFGWRPLDEQGRLIPEGKYVLVEDDTVTGGTIASALSHLPKNVEIEETIILSDFADYAGVEYYDVVDLRDFIVGSYCGGLSVVLPTGAEARAPYALPYVSLRSRAKIPATAEMEISRVIWQANLRFFSGTEIKVSNTDPGFQALMYAAGYMKHDLMSTVCLDHIDKLLYNV